MHESAPILVFADDWGRHPSSCQHLIARLLPRHDVAWVNTIGTRPPRLNGATVKRGLEKLGQWFLARPVPGAGDRSPSPRVVNPKMWPSFRSRLSRGLNRRLLIRAIRPILDTLPCPPVVITTLPLVADLVGAFPASRWVYYCVDDFGVWPGLDGGTLRAMEAELVAKVDTVISVSETLRNHLKELGRESHLLTHGVDLEHFRNLPSLPAPPQDVLFWGVVDRRMDQQFVHLLGEKLRGKAIRLVGPQDNPDPLLAASPQVRLEPAVAYQDLPALAASAAVLIMPYADLPVTRAMQPLKLKEYLATGKPVVVRKLPATEPWADCCDVCETAEQFAEAVKVRLEEGIPESQRIARQRLGSESWQAKAEQLASWSGIAGGR